MPELPSGTVTFLFTDIERSTQRLLQLGSERYALLQAEHQRLVRAACAVHGGVEVDTQGDAFFVAFPTASGALAAAIQAQRALAAGEPWPDGQPLPVRMGLHTGTPLLVGDHYIGLDVVRAARIAAAGHGGQVLLSEATRGLVEHDLPAEAALRDVGSHRLKDLQRAEHLYQLVLPGLPADFAPLRTLDARPHNLPVQPTPPLGREETLATVTALVRREDVRLVTLTGPGGVGKTRLGQQVAAELVEDFADGVWYVRLARLSDPSLVLPTVAQTLGLQEAGDRPIQELLREYVRTRQLLLVLDNFEQVVAAATEVAALLDDSPGLSVLATSRLPLHLRGEKVYPVSPLSLADPRAVRLPEHLAQSAAVALFIQRAQDTLPDFALTPTNAPAIAAVCARLDGLPLAIELAAARVRLLPPEALLERLEPSLPLLTGGPRDLDSRQQTMRAALAWSEDLLALAERMLFRRLAVFVGGWTLEAAEAVCVAPEGAAPLPLDLLDGLSSLVEQSLVQPHVEKEGPRFSFLQVIREFALEQLQASKEEQALRQAHAACMVALVERMEPELYGGEPGTALRRLEDDYDNLRAALGWARERGPAEVGLRLIAGLWRFWEARGFLSEARAWVDVWADAQLALGPASTVSREVRARALMTGGVLALWQGDAAVAEKWLQAAAQLGEAVGDLPTAARAVNGLGQLAARAGDWARALTYYTEGLTMMRAANYRWGIATALTYQGAASLYLGDLERAKSLFEEALAIARQDGHAGHIAANLAYLGEVARRKGETRQAAELQREALALDQQHGHLRGCAEGLEHLACTAGAAGQGARAARLLGAALALRETLGATRPAYQRAETKQAVAGVRAALGEAAWAAAFAAGQSLSSEDAIAEALGEAS
jgi:predicted ATPase/class 3 adenylate cyclase